MYVVCIVRFENVVIFFFRYSRFSMTMNAERTFNIVQYSYLLLFHIVRDTYMYVYVLFTLRTTFVLRTFVSWNNIKIYVRRTLFRGLVKISSVFCDWWSWDAAELKDSDSLSKITVSQHLLILRLFQGHINYLKGYLLFSPSVGHT